MTLESLYQNMISWFLFRGTRVIIILVTTYLATRFLRIFIIRLTKSYIKKSSKIKGAKNAKIQKQREKTLASVFISTLSFIIWTMALFMILSEFSINIVPLLGGAGIVGLAIGMGSRSLIQDYLSGLFILLEDQYRVGEKVEIAGIRGKVKSLNLRRTVLKNLEGTICYIPNGQIKKVSNFSRTTKKIKK